LREKKGLPTPATGGPIARAKEDSGIEGIRVAFQKLEHAENPQQRGRDLEKLVFELCKITLGMAAPSYAIAPEPGGVIRQIDGYFSAPPDRYRVECKWLSEPVGQNEIVLFRNKLDVAGISGLFISMAGFKETAVTQAKKFMEEHAILLMDGEEARAVFNGYFLFDQLLKRKRQHFDQLSNPYHRVLSGAEIC
jgi:hypothetical protein